MSHRTQFTTHPAAHPEAIVQGENYRFTVITDGIVRFEYASDNKFEDRASFFALNRAPVAAPKITVVDNGSILEIFTERLTISYDKRPPTASGLTAIVIKNVGPWDSTWTYGASIHDDGLVKPNLGGTTRTLDGIDGKCKLEEGLASIVGYSYIDDSSTMLFTEDGWVAPRVSPPADGQRVDGYLFGYGQDYKQAVKDYLKVSGKQPVISRWAFGNWWSRYYKYTAQEYLELHDRFKKEELPFSVAVIDMDWHIVDVDKKYGNGWTGWTWNKDLFPDPPAFLKALADRNLKTTLNIHPADGVRAFEDSYAEMAKALGRTDGQTLAFDVTDKKFMDAYFDILHRKLEDEGVDFWWIDYQQRTESRIPGINNLNVLNHYHFLDSGRQNRRPLTFSRYAGPGSQRYPVGFSGDALITWDSLNFQPEFTVTASNVAYGLWSNDIGGHMLGYRDDELTARWVQLGVFSPILRLHSSDNVFISKEPWHFGAEIRDVMSNFLRLRHRLIPYLYSMNLQNSIDDEPLMQPMYWKYPEFSGWSADGYSVPNQFTFGSELLVAPITSPRDPKTFLGRVKAWLPPGTWVDFFTGQVYDGDRHCWLYRKVSDYPVFMQPGGILPTDGAATMDNACGLPKELEVVVCVGADGKFDLLEDDGNGNNLDSIDIVTTPITYSQATGTLTIGPCSNPQWITRSYRVRFLALDKSASISAKVGKGSVPVTPQFEENGIIIDIPAVEPTSTVVVELGGAPKLAVKDYTKTVFDIIQTAQIHYEIKQKAWKAVQADVPVSVKIANLQALTKYTGFTGELECPEGVLNAMLEPLLADHRVLHL